MTWTKEREDWIRECVSRNPEMETVEGHDWRGRAADLLSWLDAEREARQRAERERDEARADEQKARDLLLASEHARQSLRAERDAIAARYDALRAAAESYAEVAEVSAGHLDTAAYVDDEDDERAAAYDAMAAARADLPGAARERAERQAERERRAAVVGYACAVNRHGGVAAESAILANADVMAEIDEMLADAREYDGEPVITERERAIAVAAYASGAFAHCDKGGVTASQIRAAAKERADEIIASVRGRT